MADLALAMQRPRCAAVAEAEVEEAASLSSLVLMRWARLKPWSSVLEELAELLELLTRQAEPMEPLEAIAPSSASEHPEETLA